MVSFSKKLDVVLQKFLTPIVQTLIAVSGLLGISVANVFHPFFEEFRILFQH
jgi:hypothetical protein